MWTVLRYLALLAASISLPAPAQRVAVLLDGVWEVEESVEPDRMPSGFGHRGPVPGLANLARPAFPDVDLFDSRELVWNRVRRGQLPESALTDKVGVARQRRNYFWYRRSFRAPAKRDVATLKINKAQFGTAVWLNGTKIGEHVGCFTAGYFDLTGTINWEGENVLVVRIGAHPGALPEWAPAGTDFEKTKWTPGIYDSVTLLLADHPVIETVQVAPRVSPPAIVVQTKIRNGGAARSFTLTHRVREWRTERVVAEAEPQGLRLEAGEERVVTQTIAVPGAKLWTPETPQLYVLDTSTGGDSAATRFGVREFRFDTATRRAYLNGQVYFLRGSNITLHRFFEDPACGDLPWKEAWVRRLLGEIPKELHWNAFRFCIGPVPEMWLDIADEAGLLIQNEFFIWTGRDRFHREWDTDELIRQYGEWMRDNWNHPSVVIWDANNETVASVFAERIIPAVRHLDLSNRPWENGYNLPAGPDDVVEDHPYLFSRLQRGGEPGFRMTDLERGTGAKSTNSAHPTGHAAIINEYGWLWLNRDGTPTELTGNVYKTLVGERATAEQRFAANAYYLAGLTEYWRAHRNFAGVLHFVYLTASFPGAFTSDHFQDVRALRLEPHFEDYVGEAFKPVGVYLNFWQPELKAGELRSFAVSLVNDEPRPVSGRLVLSAEGGGGEVAAREEIRFEVGPHGQHSYLVRMKVPPSPGEYLLKAAAHADDGRSYSPVVSRRKVTVTGP